MNLSSLALPLSSRRWRRVDFGALAFVVVLAGAQLVGTYFAGQHQPERRSLDALGVTLLLVGPIALLWRHSRPLTSLWIVLASTMAYLLIEYPYGPVVLSIVVSVYTVVTEGHRLAGWLAAGVLYFGHFSLHTLLREHPPATLTQLVGVGAWLLVVLAGSEFMRVRKEQTRERERARLDEERSRLSEERLGIARDVHDVVAHNISLINVQASVALHLMDEKPEQARIALAAIKEASKDGLAELGSILGTLRHDDQAPPREPVRGLSDIDDLVADAELTGIHVSVVRSGTPRPLPTPVDLAAFRIVQESLTNVRRHAEAHNATVRLDTSPSTLTLEVEDDGVGASTDRAALGGNGLRGMRERVVALGGEFVAGPGEARGWRVEARFPLDGQT